MIEIKGLTKKFPDVIAINNLDLTINPGIIGLVGHNGAGKSTLLRMIADVFVPDSGSITINGLSNQDLTVKDDIFYLSDTPYYPRRSFIKDVFYFYSIAFSLDKEYFDKIISLFGLSLDRRVDGFSKGMLRQLFIAIALSSKAKILLLDEAFDGIDPLTVLKIKDLILEKKKSDTTIIISSHNIATLQNVVDQYIVLSKGKIASMGEEKALSASFIKYQILTDINLTKEMFINNGFTLISLNKVGSLYHLVFLIEDDLEERIKKICSPKLFEAVQIASDELILIEMQYAKMKENNPNE